MDSYWTNNLEYEILEEKYINMQLLMDVSICMIKPIIISCFGAELMQLH